MRVAEKQGVALFFLFFFFFFFDGQFTFINEPRHLGQPGFALGFWDDFGGSRGEQMGELKSRVFPREDGFFSNSRSTEIRVKIPVYISKIPSSDIWGFFNLAELH